MSADEIEIVGRSSSHFSRTVRMFAIELGVPFRFTPVFDLTALDGRLYAENPVMKVPVMVTAEGPWFGSENIARELTRRSGRAGKVAFREHIRDRIAGNAEELTVQAMHTEVTLIMAQAAGDLASTPALMKARQGLAASLVWLDSHVDRALAALPPDRELSFFEVALFCLVTHLPFRSILPVDPYARLAQYVETFGQRRGAQQTPYHFDKAP
jgi:glutathione S-transferase